MGTNTYRVVLRDTETRVDFDASGEELLIVRTVGADVILSLLTPDDREDPIPLRTFSRSGQQRWRCPKDTRLRLQTVQAGATAWVGKIYADSAGDLL